MSSHLSLANTLLLCSFPITVFSIASTFPAKTVYAAITVLSGTIVFFIILHPFAIQVLQPIEIGP